MEFSASAFHPLVMVRSEWDRVTVCKWVRSFDFAQDDKPAGQAMARGAYNFS